MAVNPDLVPAFIELFHASSVAQWRAIVHAHPALLDAEAESYIRTETANLPTLAALEHVDRLLWMLDRCRKMGIDAHFDETEGLGGMLRRLDQAAKSPRDLNVPGQEETASVSGDTLAAISIEAFRGENYPYSGAGAAAIKATGNDEYLIQLAHRLTTEQDWVEAARKIEEQQRAAVRKYLAQLAERSGDPSIARIGFEFIQCETPNAMSLPVEADGSFAIGLDPGLQSLFTLLFHAARLALYYGEEDFFIGLACDLVQSHYLGEGVEGLEEKILALDRATGVYDRHWADWGAYVSVCFLVGHEVGHVHLGHFQRHSVEGGVDSATGPSNWPSEFDADEWSAKQLIEISNGVSLRIGACTMPAIFLSVQGMLDDLCEPVNAAAQAQRNSYPPARERAQRLAKIGAASIPNLAMLPSDMRRLFELPKEMEALRGSARFRSAAARLRSRRRR